MAKTEVIQIRLTETLKKRYIDALSVKSVERGTEYNQTDHLTEEIISFVQAVEKEQQAKVQPSSK